MISNIHKTVISEIENKKPRYQIMSDLSLSFCALVLSEIKNADDELKEAIINFASGQLEQSFRLIQNYKDILGCKDIESILNI